MADTTSHEIANRFVVAEKIAIAIKAYAQRQHMDVDDVLESLTLDSHWAVFARIAGQRDNYLPSAATQAFVRGLLHYEKQRLCTECGLRMASRESTPHGKPGTEVCDFCWSRAGTRPEAA